MNDEDLDATSIAEGITRREVLAWSTVAAAGALATPRVASAALAAAPPVAVEPMSVGYLAGSRLLDSYAHLSWDAAGRPGDGLLEVVPAVKLDADPQAYETVRVRVAGLYPSPEALAGLGLALTVLVPTDGATVPFYPWSARAGSTRQVSAPISFDVPLHADGGLELLLEVIDPNAKLGRGGTGKSAPGKSAGGTKRVYGTRFTSSGESGVPRLQRGLYLLATRWGMWEQPTLLPPADKPPRLDRLSVVLAVEPSIGPLDH